MVDAPDIPPEDACLPRWFTALRGGVDVVTEMLNVAGTLLIVVIMLLVNADVIGRGALNAPVSGVPEIVSMSIVAIVFLQIAQTFRMGRLTRSDAVLKFVQARSRGARDLIELVFAMSAAALVWVVFWASLPLFRKAWVRNTFEGTVGDFTAPVWPVKLIILIGCAALFVQIVLYGAAAILRLIRGRSA